MNGRLVGITQRAIRPLRSGTGMAQLGKVARKRRLTVAAWAPALSVVQLPKP